MKVAIFDTHSFETKTLGEANLNFKYELNFLHFKLTKETASIAQGHEVVCAFTNDKLDKTVLEILSKGGTKFVALRSAGFNHIDLKAASDLGIKVARVPEYSPYSIAEYAVGLILTLNRKIHKAYNRVREGNFSLDGLVGFDLHGKTIGVIGSGRIGQAFIRIMRGFGCTVLVFDQYPNREFATETGCIYSNFSDVIEKSDIISLHIPLSKESIHLLNESIFKKMKRGCILINTGRGGLIDTKALIQSLKTGTIAAAGLDVYEEEENYFFQDHSGEVMQDDVLSRLITFPNVLLTSHQAFLTKEALSNIAQTTFKNISEFEQGLKLTNEVLPQ